MRALGTPVAVRTAAPANLFPETAAHSAAEFEPGIAESADALRILPAETAERVEQFFERVDAIVRAETAWVRAQRTRLIVADIPFLAGEIAASAGVACVAIGNFTWDWIYEPLLCRHPRWPEWDARIRRGYRQFAEFWRLPFGQAVRLEPFRRVIDVSMIARRGQPLRMAGGRPRVLIGMRGGVPPAALERAARDCPDLAFIEPGSAPFPDLVATSCAVVSKLGYGTVAECAVNRTPLLYPPRQGFREDAITRAEAAQYMNLAELPLDDFRSGAWGPHLRRLIESPMPASAPRSDGAEVCARRIERYATRS
jgi:hypothetical protein